MATGSGSTCRLAWAIYSRMRDTMLGDDTYAGTLVGSWGRHMQSCAVKHGSRPHRQKKRLAQLICRMGRSYLALTKKSQIPRKPSWPSIEIAFSMALWNGGITAHIQGDVGLWGAGKQDPGLTHAHTMHSRDPHPRSA